MLTVKKCDIIPNYGKNEVLYRLKRILPEWICDEIMKCVSRTPHAENELNEIRLRADARSSLTVGERVIYLSSRLGYSDISKILATLTGGSLYAHRDTLAEGYIIADAGIRVGISGRARYEGGELIGVCDVRSLVFRIPHNDCDVIEELFSIWKRGIGSGLIIYSPPGGGKTTAIRRLTAKIGECGVRVAVVDERCEFVPEDYAFAEVEILRGYDKRRGIEIAVRTLGAEVVAVDEIGASEASILMSSLLLGVPIISTVHAASRSELLGRASLKAILSSGAFDYAAGIVRHGSVRSLERFRIVENGVVLPLNGGEVLN